MEFDEVEVLLDRLPQELDGLSILHLSDFHLGTLSLNGRTLERAVAWGAEDAVDLVLLTGDLLSRERARERLGAAVTRLRGKHGVFAVLGNHDVAGARAALGDVLLEDSSVALDVEGKRIQVVGGNPSRDWKARRLDALADPAADLRILLFHFPDVTEWLPPRAYDLVVAGHLHGGQICVPTPRGKIRLEHLRARYWEGLHETPAGMLHVSRGLGTSFVPFRFLARPQGTKLVLRSTG
ncbi:MAG TPA: metallophosphoesterase [Gaiellaceae bacterium]|nr:metallophosphoesterase [Gaiellaceae bacterium]